MLEVAASILAGRGFGFQIPSRTSSSQLYVSQLDRMVLKKVLKERIFANTSQVRALYFCSFFYLLLLDVPSVIGETMLIDQ